MSDLRRNVRNANAHSHQWEYRISQPDEGGPYPVVLLLHGWTGDENSMWIFTPRLPQDSLFIAPRGLFLAPEGGYAWHAVLPGWPCMADFEPAIEGLLDLLTLIRFPTGDFSTLHLVGFSQGAALAYAFTLSNPERVASLSVLSGFMPQDASIEPSSKRFRGLPVFITHGAKDTLIPVERARQAAELFELAGAKVTYCEHDVGHKLSAGCYRGLEIFYRGTSIK